MPRKKERHLQPHLFEPLPLPQSDADPLPQFRNGRSHRQEYSTLAESQELPDVPKPQESVSHTPFEVSLLALGSIRGLGRKGIAALCNYFSGNLGLVWESPQEIIQEVLTKAKVPSVGRIAAEIASNPWKLIRRGEEEVEQLADRGIHIIPKEELPPQLREIPDGPPWLFVEGRKEALYQRPGVAVVGTRTPSEKGVRATAVVVKAIAVYPITLISGLAEGIDEEAHKVSLEYNVVNIAFLGHGINLVFPSETGRLRQRIIASQGAIATEYLPNERYNKSSFVARNRLQAALADIVIPVEANPKGGTAHTIRFARKYGRPIIGIYWKGANGILEDLRRAGDHVVEISSPTSRKHLDSTLRALAEQFGHETYALRLLESDLRMEMKVRAVRQQDISRLIEAIHSTLEEQSDQ